jgi:predicted transcriptional regulator
MPLIGFTVFKDKILSGEKTQTIRKLRKNPIIVGDHLYLYWHLRQKDCEKLGEATCTEVFQIRIDQEYSLGKQHLIMDRFERLSSHADGLEVFVTK